MGNTNVTETKRDFYLDMSALDGFTSLAAKELRKALRSFVGEHGMASLKTALSTLNSENTTPVAPSNSVAPTITGTTTVGQTLGGDDGTWAGFPTPVVTAYQWYRADTAGGTYAAIAGADEAEYELVVADAAKYLKRGVTKTNNLGSLEVLSSASAQIAAE